MKIRWRILDKEKEKEREKKRQVSRRRYSFGRVFHIFFLLLSSHAFVNELNFQYCFFFVAFPLFFANYGLKYGYLIHLIGKWVQVRNLGQYTKWFIRLCSSFWLCNKRAEDPTTCPIITDNWQYLKFYLNSLENYQLSGYISYSSTKNLILLSY